MAEVFSTSSDLWVRVQAALDLTQAELGDLVGVDRRTIQRWQDRGGYAHTTQLLEVVVALEPVQPELAAAAAVGTSSAAVKPALEAAFRTARAGPPMSLFHSHKASPRVDRTRSGRPWARTRWREQTSLVGRSTRTF